MDSLELKCNNCKKSIHINIPHFNHLNRIDTYCKSILKTPCPHCSNKIFSDSNNKFIFSTAINRKIAEYNFELGWRFFLFANDDKSAEYHFNKALMSRDIDIFFKIRDFYKKYINDQFWFSSKLIHKIKYFEALYSGKLDIEICPKCGSELLPRTGDKIFFLGCPNYPLCAFSKRLSYDYIYKKHNETEWE